MLCTLRSRGCVGSGGIAWELVVDVCVGVVVVGVVVVVVVVDAFVTGRRWDRPLLHVALAFVAPAALVLYAPLIAMLASMAHV